MSSLGFDAQLLILFYVQLLGFLAPGLFALMYIWVRENWLESKARKSTTANVHYLLDADILNESSVLVTEEERFKDRAA